MGKDVYGGCATLNEALYRRGKSRDLFKEAALLMNESWLLRSWTAKHWRVGAGRCCYCNANCTVAPGFGIWAIVFFLKGDAALAR
jgi:hypothetical protein